MESQATWYELVLENRTTIIWIFSIAVALAVFLATHRKLGKGEAADLPDIDLLGLFDLTTVFGTGGGSAKDKWQQLLEIVKSKWGKIILSAAAVAVISLFVVQYVLDAGTKKLIESGMTFPAPLCQRPTRDSVLLFIHGWNGDAKDTWQQFPRLACDDPRLLHTEIFSVGYPTYMQESGFTVVETALWIYRELIDRTGLKETDKLAIIAHSMGGLIAREIALKAPTSKPQLHIVGITTISSPHNGTDATAIARVLQVSKHYTSDMKHGSSMLASLHARWNDTDSKFRPPLVCFGGVADHIVATDSAFFQCDEQYKFQQWGHTSWSSQPPGMTSAICDP
jgi:pimeloyl-ACP methyl ester carboxylesterase